MDGTEQTFKVLRIVRHPNYNPATKDTDIALLEMNEEATLNNYVGLACLPTEEPKIKLEGTCYISGIILSDIHHKCRCISAAIV